jgi:glycogen(starch) synthase
VTGATEPTIAGPAVDPLADAVAPGPIDVLVVASWFPAYDDPAKGRFVADQVDALAATGIARPSVISFDPARLSGGASSRGHQGAVVLAAGLEAVAAAEPLFVDRLPGLEPGVGVARLTIPEGLTQAAGRAHGAVHRERLLAAAAERLVDSAAGTGAESGGCVVHAHTGYPDGAAAVALADRLNAPLFVTEHASFVSRQVTEPAVRERYAAVLARAERLFAVSGMLADEIRGLFPEHAGRIEVLPNAVPVDRFPLAVTADRRPDELLFVGYRKASKGIETLLRATALAHARRPSIRLRLVGSNADADEERGWHELVAALGIADVVAFEQSRDRAGIAAAMARASLFVHPSPRETFGVVAVEALATGLPVVASDSGGVTEILGPEPERLGALVPPGDPTVLGEAILATLDRRDEFDATELRAAVVRRFGAAYVAERLMAEYRQALSGREPTVPVRVGAGGPRPRGVGPVVVVGLDRESAESRLAKLPDALRPEITLITAADRGGPPLSEVGRVVEVTIEATWRAPGDPGSLRRRPGMLGRLARLATDPRGTIDRRRGRGAGAEASLAPATDALRALAAEATAGPIDVVAIDGHDHLATEPVVRAGLARRWPGGLRRLADLVERSPDAPEG